MTKLMTQALDALRKLPDAQQDDVARFLLELTNDAPMTAEDAAASPKRKVNSRVANA